MKGIALIPIVVSLTGCGCMDMAGSEYTVSPVVATPCCNARTAVVDSTCCKTVVVARPVVTKRCCPTCYDATCY
ncbi:hypothetical protein [Legionella tunisiensis]|uniref:hypothetical protein n=1 Tax=Legionella tunisiensis TaxID=1034944 RepID=UPI0002EE9EAE|nr:hypothetical protein [Legionella tunisiensis]